MAPRFYMYDTRKKIFVMLLLLLAFSFVVVFKAQLTGWLSNERGLYLSVADKSYVCDSFGVPSKVKRYDTATFAIHCQNCGSSVLTGRSEISIFSGYDKLFTVNTLPYELIPGKTNHFSYPMKIEYTPKVYTVTGRCYYNSNFTESKKSFEVYTTDMATVKVDTLGAGPEQAKELLVVETADEINVTQSSVYPLMIKISNIGKINFLNVSLELSSSYIKIRQLNPAFIETISPDSSEFVAALLFIPAELEPGQYNLILKVSSLQGEKIKEIKVNVRVLEIKEQAKELLGYYESLLDNLEDELNKAELEEELNITRARKKYSEALDEFGIAKRLYNIWLYNETIDKLNTDVWDKIQEVLKELNKAEKIEKPEIIYFPAAPAGLWLYLLIIAAAVLLAIAKKQWEKNHRDTHGLRDFRRW